MPFKSQAQRGFMYSEHPEMAKEFEAATPKGKKLPEHVAKMSDGGEVISPLVKALDALVHGRADTTEADRIDPVVTDSTETVKGYSDGGEVDPSDEAASLLSGGGNALPFLQGAPQMAAQDVNQTNPALMGLAMPNGSMPPPTPPASNPQPININASVPPPSAPLAPSAPQGGTGAPPMSAILQSMQGGGDGTSAIDRAALAQQLNAKQHGAGNLIAQGIGGIGDAITNSFGRGGQHAQQNAEGIAQGARDQALNTVDTERTQKAQDMQQNYMIQKNDPKSATSSMARLMFQTMTGKTAPSGISAAQIETMIPEISKIMDAQLTAATAKSGQRVEEVKAAAAEGPLSSWIKSLTGNPGQEALNKDIGGSSAGSNGGWSVVK